MVEDRNSVTIEHLSELAPGNQMVTWQRQVEVVTPICWAHYLKY